MMIFSFKQFPLSFLIIFIILSITCCTYYRTDNTYSFEPETETKFIYRDSPPYKVNFERDYSASVGTIITIRAIPEYVLFKEDTYEIAQKRQNKIKGIGYPLVVLGSLIYLGHILAYENMGDEYKGSSLSTIGGLGGWAMLGGWLIVFTEKKFEKSKIVSEKKRKLVKSRTHKKITAIGSSAYLKFSKGNNKYQIYLGKFNTDNILRFHAKELLNNPIYKFKNEEEILHYMTFGEIEIKWREIY